MCVCVCRCVPCACLVFIVECLWNWSQSCLWAAQWVLGTEPRSFGRWPPCNLSISGMLLFNRYETYLYFGHFQCSSIINSTMGWLLMNFLKIPLVMQLSEFYFNSEKTLLFSRVVSAHAPTSHMSSSGSSLLLWDSQSCSRTREVMSSRRLAFTKHKYSLLLWRLWWSVLTTLFFYFIFILMFCGKHDAWGWSLIF